MQEEIWWSCVKHQGICIRGSSNVSFKASLSLTWIFDLKSCWFHISSYPGTEWKWWEERLDGGNEQEGKDLVIKAEDLDPIVIDRRRLLWLIVQARAPSQYTRPPLTQTEGPPCALPASSRDKEMVQWLCCQPREMAGLLKPSSQEY